MAKLQRHEVHLPRDRFASLLAIEIERTDTRHCQPRHLHTIAPVGVVAGNVAAAITFLTPEQQRAIRTINDELAGIALAFVHTLVEEAMRRSPAVEDAQRCASAVVTSLPSVRTPVNRVPDVNLQRIDDWAGPVAGQTFLEEEPSIPRSTLHLWQRRNDVIALRKGPRRHVFPLTQFVDGRPAAGLRQVLAQIPNPRVAWSWLIAPCPELEGRVPIEMLKQDLIVEVVREASNPLNHQFKAAR